MGGGAGLGGGGGGASFLSGWGCLMGALVLVGERGFKKNVRCGEGAPHAVPLWEILLLLIYQSTNLLINNIIST